MTPAGVIYDMLSIIPYVNKNKRCPVTGAPLALKDLIKLNFHKNDKGEYHCPVMFKEFSPHTRIVAIKTTGNVYCHEAVETLNIKTKNYKDLLTDQPFTKADIITLQVRLEPCLSTALGVVDPYIHSSLHPSLDPSPAPPFLSPSLRPSIPPILPLGST